MIRVELGVPYTGWPVRSGNDYEFALATVSTSLREDVLAWARAFSSRIDDSGWISAEAHAAHEREGRVLRQRLQRELGPAYRVVLLLSEPTEG